MTWLLAVAEFFGISVFRLVMYATLAAVVTVALVSVRQHYINVGWEKHRVAVEKQDGRAKEASRQVEQKTNECSETNGFWDVITQGCKLEEAVK